MLTVSALRLLFLCAIFNLLKLINIPFLLASFHFTCFILLLKGCLKLQILKSTSHNEWTSTLMFHLLIKLFMIALTISIFLCFGINTVGMNP